MSRLTLILRFGLALVVSGCASIDSRHDPSNQTVESFTDTRVDASAFLLPAGEWAQNLLLNQRVTVRWTGEEERFEAVLQKKDDVLLLVGLGPINSVGFSLSLNHQSVEFRNRTGRELPFEPARILADVQRCFYPWIDTEGDCADCEREGRRDGVRIQEEIVAGRVMGRVFTIVDQPEVGEIRVDYEGWSDDLPVPKVVRLRNGWFGYELLIETSRAESLE
jgi:hypothetical protein